MTPPTEQLDAFATEQREKEIARWVGILAPRLRALADRRGTFGITAMDSRKLAIDYGFATGSEQDQRALSWLAAIPKAAGLKRTPRTRPGPNRNAHRVFVSPSFFADERAA